MIIKEERISMVVDLETGEVIGGKFAKLFFGDIEKLFSLTHKQRDLLFLMVKSIGLGNVNHLIMTPKRKKEYAKIIGVTTSNSISNMLRGMEQMDVVQRLDKEEEPNKFTINPYLLFSGNDYQRAKIIIEYTKEGRKVKAFKNAEAVKVYFEGEKNGTD